MDTASLYDKIETWLITAGPRILFAVAIFIAGQWFIRLLRKWGSRALERKGFASNLRPFVQSFVFTAMQVLLTVAMMNILGIQMSIFAALIGGIGVAAGLALSGTLQNFTSGILILMLKPYRTGDNIVAQGQEGTVSSIQLFYTVIITYDNRTIIIPNSKLSNELIINITQSGFRRLDTTINLPFHVAFEEVKKLVEESISHYGRSSPKPPARIGVSEVRGDGYTASIQVWLPSHGFQDETLAFREILLGAMAGSGWNLPGMVKKDQ